MLKWLVFLSGFSGFIYLVVWHRYLDILFGSHAQATTILFSLFVGFFGLGYALSSHFSRTKNWPLLKIYAGIENILALWALFFPITFGAASFLAAQSASYYGLITNLVLSVFLLAVPLFLMGTTLPLLSEGLNPSPSKDEPNRLLYRFFWLKALGGFFGSLFAAYMIIPLVGLSIGLQFAVAINLIIAVSFILFFVGKEQLRPRSTGPAELSTPGPTKPRWPLLTMAFFSGFYIVAIATVLIRLMELATGTAEYTFALVTASLLITLTLGAVIGKSLKRYRYTQLYWANLAIALSLFFLYLSGDYWSYWVHVSRAALRDLTQNYYLYQASLGLGYLLMLFVPLSLCGFGLALYSRLFKQQQLNRDEKIPWFFTLVTAGGILGALLGGHYLLYFIDLDHLFKACVVLALLGMAFVIPQFRRDTALLWIPPGWGSFLAAPIIVIVVMGGVLGAPRYHKERFLQPFREQKPLDVTFKGADAFGKYLSKNMRYLYYNDGPNASIGVAVTEKTEKEVSRTLLVNGKSDGDTSNDYFTSLMLGHVPALFSPTITNASVIGFGTGVTVGALANYDELKHIDVVEISPILLQKKALFDAYNNKVSTNEKVSYHHVNAFQFFKSSAITYDIIVANTSNPWGTGVEALYSAEFYALVRKKLAPTGMYIQWVHNKSFSGLQFDKAVNTIQRYFPHVSVFQLKEGNVALLATKDPLGLSHVNRGQQRMDSNNRVNAELTKHGIDNIKTILALEIIPSSLSKDLTFGAGFHRLEKPQLSHEASKTFFAGTSMDANFHRRKEKMYFYTVDDAMLSKFNFEVPFNQDQTDNIQKVFCDQKITKIKYFCSETLALGILVNLVLKHSLDEVFSQRAIAKLMVDEEKKKFSIEELRSAHDAFKRFKEFYSPIARFPVEWLVAKLNQCIDIYPKSKSEHGECLLRAFLVHETMQTPERRHVDLAKRFDEWVGSVPTTSKNYAQFKAAREYVRRFIELDNEAKRIKELHE